MNFRGNYVDENLTSVFIVYIFAVFIQFIAMPIKHLEVRNKSDIKHFTNSLPTDDLRYSYEESKL